MRSFRAIYNHARKTARTLPIENPVGSVDWNTEQRRDTALGPADLKGWFAQLDTLENPVRREFHLFVLRSGSRPDAIKRYAASISTCENWSSIFYGQEHLLFDPKTSPEVDRQLVFEVVSHEMADQWFGDLVTMAWWDQLWLNEGFARWMQTHAADVLHSEW